MTKTAVAAAPRERTARTVSRRTQILPALVITLCVVAAACTSSSDNSQGPAPEPESTTTQPAETTTATEVEPVAEEPIELDQNPTELYAQDFERTVEAEWSITETATTSDGRTVLGPLGSDRATLRLNSLPAHDAVTISFDLLVLGNWTGGEDNGDRWLLNVDGTQIINTGFANQPDFEQAYPADIPKKENPAGTGSAEQGLFGLTPDGAGGEQLDNRYEVVRTFLHGGDQLTVDFIGRQLGLLADQAWALDNVRVTAQSLPGRRTATGLVFQVADRKLTVSGTVPTDDDLDRLTEAAATQFKDRTDLSGVEVGNGGPTPLWFHDLATLLSILGPSDDIRLDVNETSAAATGVIRTTQWADDYGQRLAGMLGEQITSTTNFTVAFDDPFVAELAELDIRFESASAELDDEDRATLDRVAELLQQNEALVIRINGHTDSTGEDDGNKNLSRDRADAAAEYLLSVGADKDRLTANARGASDLRVDPEAGEADRALNRRVSFIIPRG